ncbi:hypothetical protein C8R43DRAFT_1127229 [Mycena crocata]|nr:hypothetical protein C8R43DRAFT_1127229 [Mycena crocata]
MPPKKHPKFEIYRSSQYWQDLHRRRQAAAANAAKGRKPANTSYGEGLLNGPNTVYTFTSRARPSGPSGSVVTTNSITASRAREDERLLARLQSRNSDGVPKKKATTTKLHVPTKNESGK